MSESRWLSWALEQARRNLIDLTRRNRLLHAPVSGKRPWCLALVGHEPDEVFAKLFQQENFRGYGFKPLDIETDEQQRAVMPRPRFDADGGPTKRPRLQTRLPSDKLEKRLTKIFREERTLEEEQGLSTLYLALGFLRWFDSDQTEEDSWAPLLLLPVTMSRMSGGDGYLLRERDDEIVANISLREKLKNDFDIQLPELPDEEQLKPSAYFESIAREIRRQPRWTVDRQSMGLAFFSFSKFVMWRDLHLDSWPSNGLLDHPLLNILLGQGADFETVPPIVPDDEPIDHHIDLSKCIHVVDADSSQTIVIEEASGGHNLVVQGPPGTGKSQTITNIIASAVYHGKRVLFVAEKAAALDVVHDRLKKAGLGALCLEIHSRKANKREVLKSLGEALRFSNVPQIDAALAQKLADRRDRLNRWSSLIHKQIGQTGMSAFDVIGLQVKLRAEGVRLLDRRLDDAASWSATKLSSIEVAINRTVELLSRTRGAPKDHPWFGTGIESQSPFDLQRLGPILNTAAENVTKLSEQLQEVFASLADNQTPSIADSVAIIHAFRHVAAAPEETRAVLANPAWATELAAIEAALDQGERLTAYIAELEDLFRPEAGTCDTAGLLQILRADGSSFIRRFSSRHRQAIAELRAICRHRPPKKLRERIQLLEKLQNAQEYRRKFSKQVPLLSAALGSVWAEHNTPWADVRVLAAWTRCALSEQGGARLLTLAARTKDLRVFSAFASALEAITTATQQALDQLQQIVRADIQSLFDSQEYRRVPIAQLSLRLACWRDNMNTANDWVLVREAIAHLKAEGLGLIADPLLDGSMKPSEARAITELSIAESLWQRAITDYPELKSLEGDLRSECVAEFRELDQARIRSARQEVLARYLDQRPNGYAGAMGIIRAEINKKRGHRAIRKLMSEAGSAVQRLKPIFLMSPLSVAQFAQPGKLEFDLLIIDEASQVAPEDALGAVARAKQIVVVGDDKQLPPTNFFKMVNAGDDEGEEEESKDTLKEEPKPDRPTDFESILTLARTRGMSERMLAWHYRSKHPSLIALSNEECYGGRLLLPPSPFVQTAEFGLSLVQTPRGHYDRGGTSSDLIQAQEVAKAVAEHIKQNPNKSLGVACLSIQQRNAVDDMIDQLGFRSAVEDFSPKQERLFVKNLESVQGDERDVVFISVGYGVAPGQSRPFLNFGPVSKDGGERRLNVLASRAREKCVVFSSITAADIPADSEVRGTRMLRALLSFAETGRLASGSPAGEFESPFEEAVARAIREAGYGVHAQVGVKGFRIDLGVIDPPRPGEFILGVECDGAAYHSARSARDRDRLRQEVLEALGWRMHRIWSTDWFRRPQREIDKLLAAIANSKRSADNPKTETSADEDLAEPDEPSSFEPLDSIATDDSEPPSSTVPYKECVLTAPIRRDLLDLSVPDVSRLALKVVEAEGPIHTEEVARRIREAFKLQKTGKRILAHVRSGLMHLSRAKLITRDGEFWFAVGADIQTVRHRRKAPLSLRRATMIAPVEYRLALIKIISDAVTISSDDLVVETARLFGFDRTGPDLRDAIDRQLSALVKAGQVERDGNVLGFGPETTSPAK